ncbi:uncharacterized protein LOC144917822, partial [Branchiostoma floridae x Branchiostoma belcheri]
NDISTINSGAFSGLGKLRTLNLDDNTVITIHYGTFTGLINLSRLYFRNNVIKAIDIGTFSDLSNLRRLHLDNNVISNIPNGTFNGLSRLYELSLNNNTIPQPSISFVFGLSNLEYLYLQNCGITSIDSITFTGLPGLSSLYLDGNLLTNISGILFTPPKTNLTNLYLRNCGIISVNRDSLRNLRSLSSLHLDNNLISNIENGTFIGLSRLRTLNLQNNSISNIENGTFIGLSRLQTLNLQTNSISNIDDGAFIGLFSLETLNLANNILSHIARVHFIDLSNLQKMNLKNNNIRHVDVRAFSYILNLAELYLDGNPLGNLTDDLFVHIPKLHVISLVRCKLTTVPTLPPSIKSIHLGGNPIQVLQSGDFNDLKNLLNPDICNQYVKAQADYDQIDEDDYSYLDYFDYYYYYNEYDDNCDYSRSYKNATDYPITTIARGAFTNLDHLTVITLRGNGIINVLPLAFVNLPSLVDVDLSYNEIAYLLPDTFVDVPRLRFLYLHGNKLTALPPELFGTLPALEKVTLYNNPWKRDCWLRGLVEWMNTTDVTYEGRSPVKCTWSPVPSLLNVSLSQVDPQSLICEQTTTPQLTSTATSHTGTKFEENTIPSPTKITVVTVTPSLYPPRDVSLVTTTATELTVQWESPSNDVMGYMISYMNTKGGQVQRIQPIRPSVDFYTIPNLSPGTTYRVCVVALYPVGRSTATNNTCITVTTKEDSATRGTGTDQTLVISLAAVSVIAAVFIVLTIVMCKLRRMQRTTSTTTHDTAQDMQMVPPSKNTTNTDVVLVTTPSDNSLDMAVGGPTATTSDDHFYMHLLHSDTQTDGATNITDESGAAPLGRQSDTVAATSSDMAAGGPTPTTPADNFYMPLVHPHTQASGITSVTIGDSGAASLGRQSDTLVATSSDMAAGGPTPTTPADNFYMPLVHPDQSGESGAASLGRQSDIAAATDNNLDIAPRGSAPNTPGDHFYKNVAHPRTQAGGVTDPAGTTGESGAASPGRQSDSVHVYEDVNETRQQHGGSFEDHVYQNDAL